MPLPPNFAAPEHLQDTIRRTYNPEVREWFADINSDNPDISTPRSSLRTACTHLENDTMDMTLAKMLLFDMMIKQRFMQAQGSNDRDLNYRVLRRTRPRVKLFFIEDLKDVERGFQPITGEISFRLMNQTATTMSETEARQVGTRIKSLFGASGGFVWKKGKELFSYTDWDKGYQLQLLARNKSEGRRIVEQVLDIQQHSPEWEFFNRTENEEPSTAFPIVPPSETILGKRQRLPRRRPIADVRFQYATLKVAGLPNEICLFDRSGRFTEVLVK